MVKDGFQQTEIGVIPNDWKIMKINEFTDTTSGGTPSTFHSEYWNGKIRWMNSGEINLKEIYEVKGRITELGLKNSSTKLIPKNCVLIALAGQGKTRGTVAINHVELCINQSLGVILPNKSFSPEYVYHNLDSRYVELRNLSSGGEGRGGLNLTLIKNINIPFPPTVTEQKLIAKVLHDTDQIIKKLKNLIEKKKNIKQGTIQELLTGKKRLEGFNEKWIHQKLGDITIDIRDGTHQTPTYVENGIPFYSVENITNDNFTETKFISEKDHQTLTKSFKIEREDILMTRIGSIGDCKLVDWDVDASFYVSLALLKLKDNISPEFIYQYSKSNSFKKEIDIHSLQWAVPKKINLGDISKVKICIPKCKDEQDEIAKILFNFDFEIKFLKKIQEKYLKIKNGMMQKLLSGEIRLN
jgi:type I restriction enzyme, S subunit